MSRSARAALTALATLTASGVPALSESYCVACYQPDAVYRCIIADAPPTASPDPRNQIQCIKQIAKSDGHARCSVERFSTAGCEGPERIVAATTAPVPIAPGPIAPQKEVIGTQTKQGPPKPQPAGEAVAPAAAGSASAEPPRTVEELAKSTVESTKKGLDGVGGTVKATTEKAGEQIEGAGSALGNAAKKSWNCLSSLFSNC